MSHHSHTADRVTLVGRGSLGCAWLLFLALLVPPGSGDGDCRQVGVVTYNTALNDVLGGGAASRLERREAIKAEIRRLDADVLCLQEVWFGEDVEDISRCLGDVYGHAYSKLHVDGYLAPRSAVMAPPCDGQLVSGAIQCGMANKCFRRRPSQWPQMHRCLMTACYGFYCQLSQACISCVVKSAANPTYALNKCVDTGVPCPGSRSMNEPGLLLLSKLPLAGARYVDYHQGTKELIERGYLDAEVAGLGQVVCTHHTMVTAHYFEPDLLAHGFFQSYIEQGDSERAELIDKFGSAAPLVLLGDLNTGLGAGPGIQPYAPHGFMQLSSVFSVVPSIQCTMCGSFENPYQKNSKAGSYVVDHIFFRGHDVTLVSRVFTPEFAVLPNGLPLSDHFGVLAMFKICL